MNLWQSFSNVMESWEDFQIPGIQEDTKVKIVDKKEDHLHYGTMRKIAGSVPENPSTGAGSLHYGKNPAAWYNEIARKNKRTSLKWTDNGTIEAFRDSIQDRQKNAVETLKIEWSTERNMSKSNNTKEK